MERKSNLMELGRKFIDMKIIGSKIYDVCSGCGEIVCLNKSFFGSIHICATEEEQVQYARQIELKYQHNKRHLDVAK